MLYPTLRPLLFKLDAETAHRMVSASARVAQRIAPSLIASTFGFEHESLRQKVWGIDFPNPVGLAAGFDKNAHLIRFWEKIGFGFSEIGSVTARRSKGNPRPRAFRLPEDRALINRMGLNNDGAERIARRLARAVRPGLRPLGVNLAKTHDPTILGEEAVEDFRRSFSLVAPHASYVVLNVSCPNTKEGKTFEEPDALDQLLRVIFSERNKMGSDVPVLVKLSPPCSERVIFDSHVEEIVRLSLDHGVAGFVATNTAPDREGLCTPSEMVSSIGSGGVSGAPLAGRSLRMIRYLFRKTEGQVPIIGVGGIASPEGAYERIRAGASLIEVYTGLIYEGPGLVKRIKEGLVALLERDGYANVSEAVGLDT